MSILKDLYTGDVTPLDRIPCKTDEYKNLTKQIQEAEENFFRNLSEEKQLEYDACVSLLISREGVAAEDLFIKAFRLGAQTMLEILHHDI
ncbi:MAG: hypothetical protein IJY93_04600 [Clostridia bacterium]|nr:hypothetical protein [Clostridia bacterium]